MSHAFQFTPAGILPMGAPVPNLGENMTGGAVPVDVQPVVTAAQRPQQVATAPTIKRRALDPNRPLTGRELMKAARARMREIDKLLRNVPALQAERASLQRLIDAAAPRRSAPVVSLKTSNS